MISAWWLIAGLWFMIRVTFTTLVEFFKLMLTTCFLRDTKNPLMGNPEDGTQSWKVVHRIISFDDVKLVKNTMNMVYIYCCIDFILIVDIVLSYTNNFIM